MWFARFQISICNMLLAQASCTERTLCNIPSAVSRQKISPTFKMKHKEARPKLLNPKAKIPKVTERFLRCPYYINLLHFHFTGWSSWSRCSNQCGKGHRIRRWECNDDNSGNHCNNSLLAREKEGCNSAELCDIGKDRTMSETQYEWRKIEPVTMKAKLIHSWCVESEFIVRNWFHN